MIAPASSYVCKLTGYKGIQGYKRGCRCDGCKLEKSRRNKQAKTQKIERDGETWASQRKRQANKKLQVLCKRCDCLIKLRNTRLEREKTQRRIFEKQQKLIDRKSQIAAKKSEAIASAKENGLEDCKFPWHGRGYSYQKGCRCKACRKYRATVQHEWQKKKIDSDTEHRIRYLMRARFRRWLNVGSASKKTSVFQLVKKTPAELIDYLLNHPASKPEFTKENYGEAWVVDHIKPLAWFDATNEEELAKAWHYTNLQPMRPNENAAKSDRMIGMQYMLFSPSRTASNHPQ